MPYRIPQVKRKNQTFSCRVSKIVGRELSKLNNNKFCTGKMGKSEKKSALAALECGGLSCGGGEQLT